MPTVADVTVKFGADTSGVDEGINHVNSVLGGLGKRVGSAVKATGSVLGSGLAQGLTQLTGGFDAVIAQGLDFGKQMANVNSILKLSDTGFNQLTKDVLGLTNNPGIRDMPAQLASGLYDIASAGFTGQDGLTILEQSAIAASAGVTQTSVAADALTSVLGAYGLGADQAKTITDQMFQTVNDGKISFEELASNMGNVLPMAAKFGVGFDQIGAAFAQMTLQGIPAAQVQTQLASLMQTALNPTEALTNAVRAQGYANAESALSALGLSGYINLIDESADSTGLTLYDLLGTTEGVNAALALGGPNAAAYADEIERVDHASDGLGATQEALNEQMKSLSFQLDKLKQQAMTLATVLIGFVAPSFAKLAGFGTKGLGKLTGWFQGIGDSYNKLRNMKGVGIGNKLGIVGPDGEVFQSKMGRMTALTTVLSTRFKALTGIKADNWFKRMGESILRPFNATKKLMGALTDRDWDKALAGFGDLIASGPKAVGDFFKGIETGIKPVDNLLHTFGKSWTDVGRLIQEAGQGDWAGFQVVLDRLGGHLLDLGGQLGGFALDALKYTVTAAISVVPVLAGEIWGAAKDLYGWIKDKVLGTSQAGPTSDAAYGGAAGYHTTTASQSGDIIDVGVALLKFGVDLAGDIWGGAKNLVGWLTSKILGDGNTSPGPGNSFDPTYSASGPTVPIGNVLIDGLVKAGGVLQAFIDDPVGGIGTMLNWGSDVARDVAVGTVNLVASSVNIVDGATSKDGGDGWATKFINAITGAIGSALTTTVDGITAIPGALADLGGKIFELLISAVTFKADLPASKDMGEKLGTAIGDAIGWALGTIVKAPQLLEKKSVQSFGENIFNMIANTLIALPAIGLTSMTALVNMGEQLFLALMSGITGFAQGLTTSLVKNALPADIAEPINAAINGIFDSIAGIFELQQNLTPAGLLDVGRKLGKAVWKAITGGIADSAVTYGDNNSMDPARGFSVSTDPLGITEMISGWIGGAKDSIVAKAEEWGGNILGALGNIVPDAGSLRAIGESIVTPITEGFEQKWNGFLEAILPKIQSFIDIVNGVIGAVNNAPWGPDIPKIPDVWTPPAPPPPSENTNGRGIGVVGPDGNVIPREALPQPEKPSYDPHETPGDGKLESSQVGGANGRRVGIEAPDGTILSRSMVEALAAAARENRAKGNPLPETVEGPNGEPAAGPVGAPVAEPPKEEKSPFVLPRKQLSLATPYSDLSKNAITALDPLRTGVPRVFSDMSEGIDRSTTTTSRDTVKSFTGMGADVIAQMTSMQGGSLAAAGLMSSGVVGGAGLMQAGTTGAAGAMSSGVVGQANSMSSGAILAAMQMAMGVYNVVSVIPVMLSTIDLRGAGYAIGASLGEGLVAGLYSQLSAVQTAAAALATAASNRTQKELGINSPSKVFMRIGESVGEGFVDGIESGYAAVAAAGRGIGQAAVQPVPNPAWTGGAVRGSGGDTYITIQITPDSEQFAEIARNARRGGAFARDLGTLIRSA